MHMIQFFVDSAFLQKLLMRTALGDSFLRQYQNLLCILDGRKPVCDHERCTVLCELFQGILHHLLALIVECGGCLVKNQYFRILRNTRAMESRCFWPPESLMPRCPMSVS